MAPTTASPIGILIEPIFRPCPERPAQARGEVFLGTGEGGNVGAAVIVFICRLYPQAIHTTACEAIAAPHCGHGESGGACRRYSSSSSQIDFTAGELPGSGGGPPAAETCDDAAGGIRGET